MKKNLCVILAILMSTILSVCFVSCGGDDDGGGSGNQSTLVDGVNVINGKKLMKISVEGTYDYISGSYSQTIKQYGIHKYDFDVEYDSKGRLSKVKGKYTEYEEAPEIEILNIDYSRKFIVFTDVYGSSLTLNFTLNKQGFISQLDNYHCSYDSYGYLTGVDSSNDIWSLTYEDNDIIKSSINNLKYIYYYYMFYGEDEINGDLLFYMNSTSTHLKRDDKRMMQTVLCFIAYQAGLFGKMTQHCTYLSKTSTTEAILTKKITKNNQDMELVLNCSFVFE